MHGIGVPLTCRGGGTSIAGNAVGAGLILDCSQNMAAILSLDPQAGVAIVQPAWCRPSSGARPPRTGCASNRTRRRTTGAPSAG